MKTLLPFIKRPQRTVQTSNSLKDRVISFRHEGLIARLMEKENMQREHALLLHNDTMKFLYLCGTTRDRHAPPSKIDTGWHHFILFTKDYTNFCQEHFGRYIHHNPGVDKSEAFPMVLHTTTVARQEFGQLSLNWEVKADMCRACDSCEVSPV